MRFLATWLMLAAFWILLSGRFDTVHLAFGFVSVTFVSLISRHHLASGTTVGVEVPRFFRLIPYLPWLLWQVVVANFDVLLRVLGFRAIEPRVIRFHPGVESEFGQTTLANSITLTPGTVTVEVEEDGSFIVHAISPEIACNTLAGEMYERVKRIEGSGS